MEAPAQLQAELGDAVIGGLARIVSYVVAPGHIRHAGYEPSIVLGELDNRRTERVEKVLQILSRARFSSAVAPDIQAALWTKFLFVNSFGGIGALTGETADTIRSDTETRAMQIRAMEEVLALAIARGIALTRDSIESALAIVDSLPSDATSSMQRDIAGGRPSELESQNGAFVRLARETGVDVPTHESIYRALLPLELKARGNQSA